MPLRLWLSAEAFEGFNTGGPGDEATVDDVPAAAAGRSQGDKGSPCASLRVPGSAFGAPKAFFAVTQRQWRHALRRMMRSKFVRLPPSEGVRPGLSAGAFAVRKDEAKDRLIGDRRPWNAFEASCAPTRLPY